MASYRHLARIAVMQTLFEFELRDKKTEPDLEKSGSSVLRKLKDLSFAKELLKGVLEKRDVLLKKIQEEAPEWPLERIAPVDKTVLLIGAYEILFSADVPPIVAIDEAVEMAKEYGDVNSGKFVNGVLSTIMHKNVKSTKFKNRKED